MPKKLLGVLAFILFSIFSFAQTLPAPVTRSYPSVPVIDARVNVVSNFSIPKVADTAHGLNGGQDSLGMLIYSRADSAVFVRSISSGSSYKWMRVGIPAGGGTIYSADESTLHLNGSNQFLIKSTYPGQPSIITLGTISTGTWQATPIADAYISSAPNWNAKLGSVLNSAYLFIGNASNQATGQPITGDLSILNTGAATNVGLKGNLLPALSTGLLRWNGSAWVFDNSSYLTLSTVPNTYFQSGLYAYDSATVRLGKNPFKEDVHLDGSNVFNLWLDSLNLFMPLGNSVFGASASHGVAKMEISTGGSTPQLSLYNTANSLYHTDFRTDNSGALWLNPSGANLYLSAHLSPANANTYTLGTYGSPWLLVGTDAIELGRRTISDANSTLATGDYLVAYTSISASRSVTLPAASSVPQQYFIIKDESGNASATNTIMIVGTVDGVTNPTAVNAARGYYGIYSDGTAYHVWLTSSGSGGSGVTSVGFSSTDFSVSGSPITSSGTITANLITQGGLTAGSYTNSNLTVNSKGVITAISNGSGGSSGWSLTGNSITPGASVIGTSNNATFIMEANNARKIFIDSVGNIGFGALPNKDTIVGDPPHLYSFINDSTNNQVIEFVSVGGGANVFQNNVHWLRYGGRYGAPTQTLAGWDYFSFGTRGYASGTNAIVQSNTAFQAEAGENQTSTGHGAFFNFEATPNGSTTRSRVMRLYGDTIVNSQITKMPQLVLSTASNSFPSSAAILDLQSTTQGFKLPVMTSTQRNAIANTQALLVYSSSSNDVNVNNGSTWVSLANTSNSYTWGASQIMSSAFIVNSTQSIASGTLAAGTSSLAITATEPSTLTATQKEINNVFTTSGSANSGFDHIGMFNQLAAGYTGTDRTVSAYFYNSAAGTGNSVTNGNSNNAVNAVSIASTTGTEIGQYNYVGNGNMNYGFFSVANLAKNSATNVGGAIIFQNTGTSSKEIGLYIGAQQTDPTFSSSGVLKLNNGADGITLIDGQVNGSTKFQVDANGNTTTQGLIANITTNSASTYTISGTDYTVIQTGSTASTYTYPTWTTGRLIWIVNQSSAAITTSASYTTLAGSTSTNVAANTSVLLQYDGSTVRQIK